MADNTISSKPSANSLKNELRESLKLLKTDFDNLKHFVEEVSSDGVSVAPMPLAKDDIADLLSVTQEIRDAANDIEFEADKIKDKLSRFIL